MSTNLKHMYISAKQLEVLQLKGLNKTLQSCRRTQLYNKKHQTCPEQVRSLEQITDFPLTFKEELRGNAPFGGLAVEKKQLIEYHESFGTTGNPISVWLTSHDFAQWTEQIAHCAINFQNNDVVLVRFPYAISDPAHIVQAAAKKNGACVVPVSSRTVISPHTRVITLLKKLQATIIGCLPLEIIFLAETAKLLGYNPAKDFSHLRGFCVAGEMLSDTRKALLEKLWNAKVYNMYGTTENGNIAADCPQGSLHAAAAHFLLEVLDPLTYVPVSIGNLGMLTVTTLTLEACPLVRYVTGDIVALTPPETCSCGQNGYILKHFGRYDDRIKFGNTTILPYDLQEAILQIPGNLVSYIWMVGVTKDNIIIRAESENPNADTSKAENFLKACLNVPTKLNLLPIGELFDRRKLLETTPVIKPRYVADWTAGPPYVDTLEKLLAGYHTF